MQLSDFLTDFFAKHPELKKFKRYIQEHVIQDHSRIFEMKALSNGQHQIGLIVASCSTGGNRSGDGGNEGRPGDWVCPDSRCAELNFAFRDVCRQCPKRKPADNSQTPRSRLTSRPRPRSRPQSPSPAHHQSRKQSSNGSSSSKRSDVKVAGVKQEQPASPAATAGVVLKTAEREKRKRSSNTGSVVECKPHQEKEKGGGSDQPHLHATTSPTQQPKKVKITKAKAVVGRSETTVMEAEQTEIPIVLCFSGFKRGTIGYEPKDKVSMAQQARTVLGASVLGSFNQTCTHLVCPPKTRTMQTLQAVLEGSWVGSKDWLMASLATRRQLPTAGYGVKCAVSPFANKLFALSTKFIAENQKKEKRLTGKIAYFEDLVQAGKGKVTKLESDDRKDYILVVESEKRSSPHDLRAAEGAVMLNWLEFLTLIPIDLEAATVKTVEAVSALLPSMCAPSAINGNKEFGASAASVLTSWHAVKADPIEANVTSTAAAATTTEAATVAAALDSSEMHAKLASENNAAAEAYFAAIDAAGDGGGAPVKEDQTLDMYAMFLRRQLETQHGHVQQLQTSMHMQQHQAHADYMNMQQHRDSCYNSYIGAMQELNSVNHQLAAATNAWRGAEQAATTTTEQLRMEIKAAKLANDHHVKTAEADKFQYIMKLRVEMMQLKKVHEAGVAEMKAELEAKILEANYPQRDLIAELGMLRSQLTAEHAEVVTLQTALSGNTAAFTDLHAQIAAQGDALGTAEADAKSERDQKLGLKVEIDQLKEILSRMSKDTAASAAAHAEHPGQVRNDAYQTHLISQIKDKNESLYKMREQGKETALHLRQAQSAFSRQKKEIGALKAKVSKHEEKLAQFTKKEATHIRLLREKDGVLSAKDQQIAEHKAMLEEYGTECQVQVTTTLLLLLFLPPSARTRTRTRTRHTRTRTRTSAHCVNNFICVTICYPMYVDVRSALNGVITLFQAAFDDISNSLSRIKELKKENQDLFADNNALTKSNGDLTASVRAIEQQLANKASETEQALGMHKKILAQASVNETMVARLKLEIADMNETRQQQQPQHQRSHDHQSDPRRGGGGRECSAKGDSRALEAMLHPAVATSHF